MHPFARAFLQGEQPLGVQISLVVGARSTRENRLRVVLGGVAGHNRSILVRWVTSSQTRPRNARQTRRRSPQRVRPRTLDELVGQTSRPRRGLGAAPRDRGRPDPLDDPLRPARGRQDDARANRRRDHGSRVRGAVGRLGTRRRRPRRAPAGPRPAGSNGARTILFLDEIHRFNKAQQDALLPAVESGLVTLIGATTENPYFEVNAALLSRCAVIELEPLSDEEIASCGRRGARPSSAPSCRGRCRRSHRAPRRRRRAQRAQHARARLATAQAEGVPLEERHVADAARKRPLRYDRAGDQHYDIISAFIKSMRGGDPDAAVYYLAAMLEGGEDARFIARRMVILASEDVGNADPQALVVAVAAAQALEHVGLPEAQLNLAQAAIYLANAPKSNASATSDLGGTARCRGSRATLHRRRRSGRALRWPAALCGARRGLRLARTTTRAGAGRPPPRRPRGRPYYALRERRGGRGWRSGRVSKAPDFDLEEEFGGRGCD